MTTRSMITAACFMAVLTAGCTSDNPDWWLDQFVALKARVSKVEKTAMTGVQGPKGDPGEQGLPGINGKDGLNGKDGHEGPAGAQGPQGPIGLTGPTGATGPQGLQGAQGIPGPVGMTGPQGQQGPAGPSSPVQKATTQAGQGIVLGNMIPCDEASNVGWLAKMSCVLTYKNAAGVPDGWVISVQQPVTVYWSIKNCQGTAYAESRPTLYSNYLIGLPGWNDILYKFGASAPLNTGYQSSMTNGACNNNVAGTKNNMVQLDDSGWKLPLAGALPLKVDVM